jgi:membrane protein
VERELWHQGGGDESASKIRSPVLLIIGFMTWMWLSIIVALVGPKLDAEIHQTARESTTGPPKPLGQRGAKIDHTTGPAKA